MSFTRSAGIGIVLVVMASPPSQRPASAGDAWRQWGGPNRNFMVDAKGLADAWPEGGPRAIWSRPLGPGHSSILVDDGRLYTMYRVGDGRARQGPWEAAESVIALDAATGKTIWEHKYASKIEDFLAAGPYAVVGVSTVREKYGNKVLRCYLQHGLEVFPVHPKEREIEGVPTVPDIASLPEGVRGLSMITPPPVTEKLVAQAAAKGIRRLWMQPGAESPAAIATAESLGLSVIAEGPCILVVLGYREKRA